MLRNIGQRVVMKKPTINAIRDRATFTEAWSENFTATGKTSSYKCRVHFELDGFKEIKTLTAREKDELQTKFDKLKQKFEAEYRKVLAKEYCVYFSYKISQWEGVLKHTLSIDDALDWDQMQIVEEFAEEEPKIPKKVKVPAPPSEDRFRKPVPFLDLILGREEKLLAAQKSAYTKAYNLWEGEKRKLELADGKKMEAFEEQLEQWKSKKAEFENQQLLANQALAKFRADYKDGKHDSVIRYIEQVLANSKYPDNYKPKNSISYDQSGKVLVLDFQLPSEQDLPAHESAKFTVSTQTISYKEMSASARAKLHESVMYQVALRTIHEIFESDVEGHVEGVVFNGYLEGTDRKTGASTNNCIMSVSASKDKFEEINLAAIDPKECFKGLKGISASKLNSSTPVKPIATVDSSDRRFVDARDIAQHLDGSVNLASMHWEDFEHLVRELFQQEFGSTGTEVKVTQASSDGGVDAIAIDPDPIRGGKIVIQAKRYTNVVGVSSVRDLWGTVQHEGAMKGILVTTSDYGPDSYEFVKDKPITLLSGSNLLHLLEKHGHKAFINITAARTERLDR